MRDGGAATHTMIQEAQANISTSQGRSRTALNHQQVRAGRNSVLIALMAVAMAALGQGPAAGTIPGVDLAADLEILRKAYGTMHPGLLRYNSQSEMDAAFNQTRKHWAKGATTTQVFADLALLTSKVRCGHTYPNFFNQRKEIVEAVLASSPRVPFYFTWMDGAMVVTRDLTPDHSLPVGTQVLKLNGVNTSSILSRLLSYVRADGANNAKRIALLAVNGESRWEAFDIYYPIVFAVTALQWQLTVRRPGASAAQLMIAAMSDKDREAIRNSAGIPGPNDALFSKRVLGQGIAVIRMPSWALFDSKWDWRSWIDSAIDDAVTSKAPGLILDLRGNEGGDDEVGRFILSRLVDRPFSIENYARLVKYRIAPEALAPYLDTWDRSFLRLGADAVPFTAALPHLPSGNWFALAAENPHAGAESILPRKVQYRGRLVVLIDSQNSSATFQFADAVQQNHLGTLLGEATGGNQRGINGGAFFFLRLPHSGIEVDLPLIGYFAQEDRPDAGLRPDRSVVKTREDVVAGRDPQMAAAEALIP